MFTSVRPFLINVNPSIGLTDVLSVNSVCDTIAITLPPAVILKILWLVLPESLTTCAVTPELPKSGDASGPTKINSDPAQAYNCLAEESHQKSPCASPEGAVALTSAPPAAFHLPPS